MRQAARIDDNQTAIVKALQKMPGVSVCSTAAQHNGFPDIAVGFRQRNYFFEIKDPDKPPSKQRLTPDQEKWHGNWTGQVDIITSVEQALVIMGISKP